MDLDKAIEAGMHAARESLERAVADESRPIMTGAHVEAAVRAAAPLIEQAARAEAIRSAARLISEDEDMHLAVHVGDSSCVGCRWRARLVNHADEVEMEACDGS